MPRGRPSTPSIPELERMLLAQRSAVARLQRRRDRLQKQVDAVDRQIAAVGGGGEPGTAKGSAAKGSAAKGSAAKAAGRRPRNGVSLGSAIAAVMAGKGPMGIGDVFDAVVAGGYRSGSANFRGIVNQALIKDKRFQSAGRGLYAMK